jgi:hypothetical protein
MYAGYKPEETPAEIRTLVLIEDKIFERFDKILEKKDIDELLIVAEKYFKLSTNLNFKVMAFTHVNRLVDEIYLQINRLNNDAAKIELSINLIEFVLKNKIDMNIGKLNYFIWSILQKYNPQYVNINLKKIFDISVNYSHFHNAEFCVRKMFFGQNEPTCLDSSVFLSERLYHHGYYDKANEILNISKLAMNVYLHPDQYRDRIRFLNQSILTAQIAARAHFRQQKLASQFQTINIRA